MNQRYFTPTNLSRISFNAGPLCTGLARFRHNLILTLWTHMKLLQHSDVSSMLKSTIAAFVIYQTLFQGFLECICYLLESIWFGWLPFFTGKLNESSKQPMLEKKNHRICYVFYYQCLTCSFVCFSLDAGPEVIWHVYLSLMYIHFIS